jgi:glutamyl-tRNA(Gln) amidotransferase subunit D
MKSLKPGTHLSFSYRGQALKGMVLNEEEGQLVIKLDSGYNISAKPAELKDVEELKVPKKAAKGAHAVPGKKGAASGLPRISILHTGGTIASKVDYETGGTLPQYDADDMLKLFPELNEIAQISSRLVRAMWSEDMRFAHYNVMAQEIAKEFAAGADGVIITHGTDTMHYTGAALSFALENLHKPVLIVGSQRSSDRASSDAATNLVAAILFMTRHPDFALVGLCMHETPDDEWCVILPGTKCRKMHSSRRDAFRAINAAPWARVHPLQRKVELLFKGQAAPGNEKLEVRPFKEDIKVGLLKAHPQMFVEEFEFFKGYDGLLLEGTGIAGNIPINEIDGSTKEHSKIAKAVKALSQHGTVVAAATQTVYGRIDMNVYSTGRKMQDLGIIGHLHDMHPETAFIKLAWLLSNYSKDEAKRLFTQDLRGEISARSTEDGFRE